MQTCLAFAMQLAAKIVTLDKCPDVTAEVKSALDSASQPPIKLVTIGTGEEKLEIGNGIQVTHGALEGRHGAVQAADVAQLRSGVTLLAFDQVQRTTFYRQQLRDNTVYIQS